MSASFYSTFYNQTVTVENLKNIFKISIRFDLKIFMDSRHKTHDQKLLFFGCLYVYKDVGSLLQYIFICCIRCDWRCVSACLMSVSAPPVVIMDTGDRGFYYDLSVLRCQPLPLPLQTHSQPTTIMLH